MGSKWAQVHLGGSRCPSSPVRFSTFLSVPTPTLHTKEAPPPLPSFLGWGAHSPPVPESSGSGVPDMFEARAAGSMGDRPGCSHDCPGRGRPWTLQAHSHGAQTAPPLTGPAPSGQVGGVAPTPQMVWGSSVGRPVPGQADTAAWAPGGPWGRLFHKPHPEEASRNQKHMAGPVRRPCVPVSSPQAAHPQSGEGGPGCARPSCPSPHRGQPAFQPAPPRPLCRLLHPEAHASAKGRCALGAETAHGGRGGTSCRSLSSRTGPGSRGQREDPGQPQRATLPPSSARLLRSGQEAAARLPLTSTTPSP